WAFKAKSVELAYVAIGQEWRIRSNILRVAERKKP
ncbi:hypothetical protein RED65_11314 [Oceanobacter sp. RED65]|nr:hypothetical protein RED65_11314 [Oceanobacter sp. RED65] [Bermanella marisrubri]